MVDKGKAKMGVTRESKVEEQTQSITIEERYGHT